MKLLMAIVDDFFDWIFKKSSWKTKIARLIGNSLFILFGLALFKLLFYTLGWSGLGYLLLVLAGIFCLIWLLVHY